MSLFILQILGCLQKENCLVKINSPLRWLSFYMKPLQRSNVMQKIVHSSIHSWKFCATFTQLRLVLLFVSPFCYSTSLFLFLWCCLTKISVYFTFIKAIMWLVLPLEPTFYFYFIVITWNLMYWTFLALHAHIGNTSTTGNLPGVQPRLLEVGRGWNHLQLSKCQK